jgi:preprotein translocase subunit SecY
MVETKEIDMSGKFLMALFAMLPAWAAVAAEGVATQAPVETVDTIWVVVFGLVFFGLIGGFFFLLWLGEKKKKAAAK